MRNFKYSQYLQVSSIAPIRAARFSSSRIPQSTELISRRLGLRAENSKHCTTWNSYLTPPQHYLHTPLHLNKEPCQLLHLPFCELLGFCIIDTQYLCAIFNNGCYVQVSYLEPMVDVGRSCIKEVIIFSK